MPLTCSICAHPQRMEIDAALASGQFSLRNIAEQFHLEGHVSLHRHYSGGHLAEAVLEAKHERDVMNIVPIIDFLDSSVLLTRAMVREAIGENGRLTSVGKAAVATHHLTRLVEIQLAIHEGARKAAAEQQQGDVFSNPEALALMQIIREELADYPDVIERIGRRIYALRQQRSLPQPDDR